MASEKPAAVFRYLLVNHVPFGRGASGAYRLGSLWLEDLRAENRAIRDCGGRLIVATPFIANLDPRRSGSFELIEISLEKEGFDYVPLPAYISLPAYLKVRNRLATALKQAITDADIVQFDASGHPMPLCYDIWSVAGCIGRKRIWVMDGGDFIAQREIRASRERNWLKRTLRRLKHARLRAFERKAVREADLVFAHNYSTPRHYPGLWGPHCHVFERSFVTDSIIIGRDELERRCTALAAVSRVVRLVVASRLTPIKAVDEVLRALAWVRKEGMLVELEIYGEGSERANLEALASRLGLAHAARFHGAVPYGPALFERLQNSHLMVVTNVVPELSRNLLLAMALGLPIIAYRNPASDPMLESSGAAMLVPTRDVDGLGRAFAAAARDCEQIVRMCRRGRAFVRERTLERCHQLRARLAANCVLDRKKTDSPRAKALP